MQIGNVILPAISTFKESDITAANEIINGLGSRGYNLAEFEEDLPKAMLQGHLLQKYGSTRTLYQLKEDAEALIGRRAGYNYVDNVKGKTGWISINNVDVDDENGELWPVTIHGQWFDSSQYKQVYRTNPVTIANEFSITGSYGTSVAENGDDVQVFDDSTEIYSIMHRFAIDCIIKNGLYQVTLSDNTITLHYWDGTQYVKIDDFSAGIFSTITLTEVNSDFVKCKTDNGIEIVVERGRIPYINSPVDLTCNSLTPSDQSTSSDNYLELGTNLYVCSNVNFSISTGTIDSGKFWIFYAVSGVQDTAHNCLVESNLKRNIVSR